jgi:hypothetical protein
MGELTLKWLKEYCDKEAFPISDSAFLVLAKDSLISAAKKEAGKCSG